jgi:tripartite-type tricarboxylate transporter receptor subunit TctC
MKHCTSIRHSLLMLVLGLGTGWSAFAQLPPDGGPLIFVVPQPAGNPTDGMARKMQPVLKPSFPAPLRAPAVLLATQTEVILTPLSLKGVRYKPEELRPVALVTWTSYLLASRPDLPATTLAELTEYARQSSGSKPLSHGHIGTGSMIHLLSEQWARKAKVTLIQVPYKGVPPVLQDLMSGQIDLSFIPLAGNTLPLVNSGRVRVFGSTAAGISPQARYILPMSRQDKALDGFVYSTWALALVPRTTPEAEVQRLHRAFAVALKNPEMSAYLTASGTQVVEPMTLAQLENYYRNETRLYRDLAREIGITPE